MSGSLNGVREGTGAEMTPFACAPDVSGSDPKPTTNNSRWSRACDWAKTHKKELITTAVVIGVVAGLALTGWGIAFIAITMPYAHLSAALAPAGTAAKFLAGFLMTCIGPGVIAGSLAEGDYHL